MIIPQNGSLLLCAPLPHIPIYLPEFPPALRQANLVRSEAVLWGHPYEILVVVGPLAMVQFDHSVLFALCSKFEPPCPFGSAKFCLHWDGHVGKRSLATMKVV